MPKAICVAARLKLQQCRSLWSADAEIRCSHAALPPPASASSPVADWRWAVLTVHTS